MTAVWVFVGGVGGILRMIAAASITAVFMYLIIVPFERSDAQKGYVKEARATAAEAKADELRRQVEAGKVVIDAYQVQLKNARAQQEADANDAEQKIAEYEKTLAGKGRSCGITDSDLEFLRR